MKEKVSSLIKKHFPQEFSFLFVSLAAVISLLIFIIIAANVTDGDTKNIDKKILLLFRDHANPETALGPPVLESIIRDITALGSSTVITIITIMLIGFLYLKKEIRSIYYVLAASIGGGIIVNTLKVLFSRVRPEIVEYSALEQTMSFPSGHSAISAVVYLSLAVLVVRIEKERKAKIFTIVAALFLTFIIGLSRVYLGVHYPTDVLGGWMIGIFWALFIWLIAAYFEKKN